MKKQFKLKMLDTLIIKKLYDFQLVGCPTPGSRWWVNQFCSSQPTVLKHFKLMVEHGYIEKINDFDYVVTQKGIDEIITIKNK